MVTNANTLCFLPKMFLTPSKSRPTSKLMPNANVKKNNGLDKFLPGDSSLVFLKHTLISLIRMI